MNEDVELSCNDYEVILEILIRTNMALLCSADTAVKLIVKLSVLRDQACKKVPV